MIAGKGRDTPIRLEPRLLYNYKDSVEGEWQKVKGIAQTTDLDGIACEVEIHWYRNIGIYDFVEPKFKPQDYGDIFIYDES